MYTPSSKQRLERGTLGKCRLLYKKTPQGEGVFTFFLGNRLQFLHLTFFLCSLMWEMGFVRVE